MTMRKVLLLIVAIVLFFALVGVFYLTYSLNYPYRVRAIQGVGIASLYYIRDHKVPPMTVDDLFKNKYLVQTPGSVAAPEGLGGSYEWIKTFQLHFPPHVTNLRLDNGHVVDNETRKETFMVEPQGLFYVFKTDRRKINLFLWEGWNNMEKGKPPVWLQGPVWK